MTAHRFAWSHFLRKTGDHFSGKCSGKRAFATSGKERSGAADLKEAPE
jgi:hypothetical protein